MSISRIGRPRRCAKSTQGRSGRSIKRGRDSWDATPIRPPSDAAPSCKPGQVAGEPDGPSSPRQSASRHVEPTRARRTHAGSELYAIDVVPREPARSLPESRDAERRRDHHKRGPRPRVERGRPGTSLLSSTEFYSPSQFRSPTVQAAADSLVPDLQRLRAPIVGPATGGTDKEARALVSCFRSTSSSTSSPGPRADRPHPERRSAGHEAHREAATQGNFTKGTRRRRRKIASSPSAVRPPWEPFR